MTNTYLPGASCVVVRRDAVVLLPADVPADVRDAVWTALGERPGVLAVLEALTSSSGAGLGSLPPFAMVVPADGRTQVAVRGVASVQVDVGGAVTTMDGAGVTTWSERTFDDVDRYAVAAGPGEVAPGTAALPLESGVVLAAAVFGGAWPEEGLDVSGGTGAVDEVAQPVAPPASSQPSTERPAEVSLDPAGESGFDALWGSTIHRGVEAAAIRPPDDEDVDEPVAAPGDVVLDEPVPDEPVVDEPVAVPLAVEADGAAVVEHTVLSSAIADLRAAAPQPSTRPELAATGVVDGPQASRAGELNGPQTLARTCVRGHLNPPQRTDCATCRAELVGDAHSVARPPLGAVTLSDGRRMVLDRPVVVGRSPRSPRAGGQDLPRLVTVPSPEGDISRSHVEIRLEGWHVLVMDLGTTNGTTLHRDGQPPVRLNPHDPVMVLTGDVVDLSDGVTLTFDGIR